MGKRSPQKTNQEKEKQKMEDEYEETNVYEQCVLIHEEAAKKREDETMELVRSFRDIWKDQSEQKFEDQMHSSEGSKPYSDLGSRLSHVQIARGATDKNHNEASRSENSAASIPSVLEPPTTPRPCSDLGSQSSDLQVGRDAFVEDHNEGTAGQSCKSLPNNSSVSGVGATEASPNTNKKNLCLRSSASNLPESWTDLNAAQENSQIQEAIDKVSSSSSRGLGQGDSTPLRTTESELLSSEDPKEFVAASGSSILERPSSSKPYSDLGSQLSYLQTERGVILKNHNEVFRSENSAASGTSALEPPTTSKPCSDLGSQPSDLQLGRAATVQDHNEESGTHAHAADAKSQLSIGRTNSQTIITDLPIDMVEEIASSLSLAEVARLSCSVKAWRNLCRTTKSIKIGILELGHGGEDNLGFQNFVYGLFLRRQGVPIREFSFSCKHPISFEFCLESWLLCSLTCQLENLSLDFCPVSPVLPSQLFTFSSLRVLKLNINSSELQLPVPFRMPNLHTLCLKNAIFDGILNMSDNEFPSLKHFKLIGCLGVHTLNVQISTLEDLGIWDPRYGDLRVLNITCGGLRTLIMKLTASYKPGSSLTITSPMLESLSWEGQILNNFTSTTNLSPCHATISFSAARSHAYFLCQTRFWKALFPHLVCTRSLTLGRAATLVAGACMIQESSFFFSHTQKLTLYSNLSELETAIVSRILGKCSRLQSVVVSRTRQNMEGFQMISQVTIPDDEDEDKADMTHLREVKIEVSSWLPLIKIFLRLEPQLDRLLIT